MLSISPSLSLSLPVLCGHLSSVCVGSVRTSSFIRFQRNTNMQRGDALHIKAAPPPGARGAGGCRVAPLPGPGAPRARPAPRRRPGARPRPPRALAGGRDPSRWAISVSRTPIQAPPARVSLCEPCGACAVNNVPQRPAIRVARAVGRGKTKNESQRPTGHGRGLPVAVDAQPQVDPKARGPMPNAQCPMPIVCIAFRLPFPLPNIPNTQCPMLNVHIGIKSECLMSPMAMPNARSPCP